MNVVKLSESVTNEFDLFWQNYPRRVGKKAARQAYARARKDPDWPGIEGVLMAIEAYKHGKPDYADWCHPTTWLNHGRWDDEYDTVPEIENKRKLAEMRARYE